MPGASLWLLPPPGPLTFSLQLLISKTLPPHFPQTKTHDFIPHITLTSSIEESSFSKDPQAWLGNLQLPKNDNEDVLVTLDVLEAGQAFVKKLTLRANKTEGLLRLAVACRAGAVEGGDGEKAEKWAEDDYLPHLSLIYADLPASEVEKQLDTLQEECRKTARNIEADDNGTVAKGGSIVLVDTTKPIHQWAPIAERELPHLNWIWPWSKSNFDD